MRAGGGGGGDGDCERRRGEFEREIRDERLRVEGGRGGGRVEGERGGGAAG
jgi:hypothetical protein